MPAISLQIFNQKLAFGSCFSHIFGEEVKWQRSKIEKTAICAFDPKNHQKRGQAVNPSEQSPAEVGFLARGEFERLSGSQAEKLRGDFGMISPSSHLRKREQRNFLAPLSPRWERGWW